MHRREFIQAAPLSIAGPLLYSAKAKAQQAAPKLVPEEYSDYTNWLEAARSAALELIAISGADDTERFMQFLALWTTAMPTIPEPAWESIDGANAPLSFGTISPGRPFVVGALKFAPGCILPAHCHPGGGGVSVCVEGSLSMQHYGLVPGSPEFSETGAVAEVREASITALRANQFTQFTPTRANLHELRAGPEGATVVDLIVQWSGAGAFSFLRFDDEPATGASAVGRRRAGTWAGMDIARAYAGSA